jgi:hypothetical protein
MAEESLLKEESLGSPRFKADFGKRDLKHLLSLSM